MPPSGRHHPCRIQQRLVKESKNQIKSNLYIPLKPKTPAWGKTALRKVASSALTMLHCSTRGQFLDLEGKKGRSCKVTKVKEGTYEVLQLSHKIYL
jgi:hypothetical protein